jgi:hypothetical protein
MLAMVSHGDYQVILAEGIAHNLGDIKSADPRVEIGEGDLKACSRYLALTWLAG